MTSLDKALNSYHKADINLRIERDKVFPVGCKVRPKSNWQDLFYWSQGTVEQGSLYADQVKVNGGHVSVNHIERLDQ